MAEEKEEAKKEEAKKEEAKKEVKAEVKEAEVIKETKTEVKTEKQPGLAVAGLVIGIIAIVLAFIPILNYLSYILGPLAIVFGIIGLTKASKKAMSIVGLSLGVAALILAYVMQVIYAAAALSAIAGAFDSTEFEKTLQEETDKIKEKAEELVEKLPSNSSKNVLEVGEIAENDNLKIIFLSKNADSRNYSKYATIKSGHQVLEAEFEFENKGTSTEYISDWDFNCYADGYDCESFYSGEGAGLSATLSTGKKTKGFVYFQVPSNAKEITLEYKDNFLSDSKVVFKVK